MSRTTVESRRYGPRRHLIEDERIGERRPALETGLEEEGGAGHGVLEVEPEAVAEVVGGQVRVDRLVFHGGVGDAPTEPSGPTVRPKTTAAFWWSGK